MSGKPPYEWWDWHDGYGDTQPSQWWPYRDEDDTNPADSRPRRTGTRGRDDT
jgi:hypothetical protein